MKEVAFTFDDGPNPPFTEQVLDQLDMYNAQAIFFLIGKNIQRHPESTQAIWGLDLFPNRTAQQIVYRVLDRVGESSIILLHDGYTNEDRDRSQTV